MENGDFRADDRGLPEVIYGEDEKRQIAALILSLNRGAFKYNRELGTDHNTLFYTNYPEGSELVVFREALADYDDIVIAEASIVRRGIRSTFSFSLESSPEYDTEVNVNERL